MLVYRKYKAFKVPAVEDRCVGRNLSAELLAEFLFIGEFHQPQRARVSQLCGEKEEKTRV